MLYPPGCMLFAGSGAWPGAFLDMTMAATSSGHSRRGVDRVWLSL